MGGRGRRRGCASLLSILQSPFLVCLFPPFVFPLQSFPSCFSRVSTQERSSREIGETQTSVFLVKNNSFSPNLPLLGEKKNLVTSKRHLICRDMAVGSWSRKAGSINHRQRMSSCGSS